MEYLDSNDPERDVMYDEVNLNKAVRSTYLQFTSNDTIQKMLLDHKLLIEEEEGDE